MFSNKTGPACARCGAGLTTTDHFCRVCGEPVIRADALSSQVWPANLGDILSRTVQLIGKAFVRYVPVILVAFLPAMLVMIIAMNALFAHIESQPDAIGILIPALAVIAVIILMIAYAAGTTAVTSIAYHEMTGRGIGWREVLERSVGIHFWRLVGQSLIIFSAIAVTVLVFVLLAMAGALLEIPGIIKIPFFVLLSMVMFVAGTFLYIRLAVAFPAVVCEDENVFGGFRRSWELVRGNWWRAFGIFILLSFITEFFISLVTTPVSLIAFWGFFRDVFSTMYVDLDADDVEMMAGGFQWFGVGMGISQTFQMILYALITPVYTTVIYYYLRVRKNEFPPPPPTAAGDEPQPAAQ